MCLSDVYKIRGKVSEQELVEEIKSCGSLSVFFSSVLVLSLKMGFFGLVSLSNDIVILHIHLQGVGSCVWAKGKSARTRKEWWDKKL